MNQRQRNYLVKRIDEIAQKHKSAISASDKFDTKPQKTPRELYDKLAGAIKGTGFKLAIIEPGEDEAYEPYKYGRAANTFISHYENVFEYPKGFSRNKMQGSRDHNAVCAAKNVIDKRKTAAQDKIMLSDNKEALQALEEFSAIDLGKIINEAKQLSK